jgi:hypothetical protein
MPAQMAVFIACVEFGGIFLLSAVFADDRCTTIKLIMAT